MIETTTIYQAIANWLQETTDFGILATDDKLIIQYCNKWFEKHLNLKRHDTIGKKIPDLFPEIIEENLINYFEEVLKTKQTLSIPSDHNYLIKIPYINKKISEFMHQKVSIYPFIYDNFVGTITQINDITLDKFATQKANECAKANEEWEMTFNAVPDLIAILDTQHTIVKINKAMLERLGIKSEDAIGKHCYELVHSSKAPPIICPHSKLLKDGKSHTADVYEQNLKGYFHVSVVPILNKEKNIAGSVHVAHDISERIATEQLLKNLSLIDDLTGIYNRRGFIALTEQLMKTADRLKAKMLLLFIDLNDMKYINDTYGHIEGDQALKNTATILQNTFRESDIIARYGGDEFVVSALQTGYINHQTITKRLNENVEAFNLEAKKDYQISLSVGISIYDPDMPVSLEDLIAKADSTMYENKYKKKRKINNH